MSLSIQSFSSFVETARSYATPKNLTIVAAEIVHWNGQGYKAVTGGFAPGVGVDVFIHDSAFSDFDVVLVVSAEVLSA